MLVGNTSGVVNAYGSLAFQSPSPCRLAIWFRPRPGGRAKAKTGDCLTHVINRGMEESPALGYPQWQANRPVRHRTLLACFCNAM